MMFVLSTTKDNKTFLRCLLSDYENAKSSSKVFESWIWLRSIRSTESRFLMLEINWPYLILTMNLNSEILSFYYFSFSQ